MTALASSSAAVRTAAERGRRRLLELQDEAGYWCPVRAPAARPDAEDVLFRQFAGIRSAELTGASARWIRSRQAADGSWSAAAAGPGDVSVSVLAYCALRLAGDSPDAYHMAIAAGWIRDAGGLMAVDVPARIWLAMFGEADWGGLRVPPPEALCLPGPRPPRLPGQPSWGRPTVLPLAVIAALCPVRRLPFALPELRIPAADPPRYERLAGQRRSASAAGPDRPGSGPVPRGAARGAALRRCAHWIISAQQPDGSWPASRSGSAFSLLALQLLGYDFDYPVLAGGLAALDADAVWTAETDGPARRLVTDRPDVLGTARAVVALADAGLPPGHESLVAAGRWLLAAQISERAGWQEGQRETAAGEAGDLGPENAGYAGAGLETSAAIIQALRTVRLPADSGQRPAILWSLRWLVAVQRADGGWGWQPAGPASAAATRLARLDLGAAETRTAAEPTGQVVRALAAAGQPGALAIRRAVTCLLRMQRPDGSWPGDGGTSDLAATCTGLQALIAAGVLWSKPPAQRAAAWLARRQSPDGGWGPGGRCAAAGSAASTPESTAAALRALLAAGGPDTDGVERAVAWLVAAQLPDGGWDGPQPAGLSQLTGPTSALGSYLSAISAREVPGPRSAPAKPAKPTKPATAGQPAKPGTAGGRPAAGARKEGRPGRIPTSPG